MADYEFRVTVEDLKTGEKRAMEFGEGDYVLIPFAPCYRASVSTYPRAGTHVVTIKDYRPSVKFREVLAAARTEGDTDG